jgi:hypothetical protein
MKSLFGRGIAPGLPDTLEGLKYTVPAPIPEKAIPVAIEGKGL